MVPLPKNKTCKDCTSFGMCKSFFDDLEKSRTCKWTPSGFELKNSKKNKFICKDYRRDTIE